MKAIVLALLVAIAIAGGAYRGRRFIVNHKQDWEYNFGCGTQDRNGGWIYNLNDRYTYDCVGYPSWMTWDGSRLFGRAPTGWRGRFQVTVNYRGRTQGSRQYWFTSEDEIEDKSWGNVWWWTGKHEWSNTIVCPQIFIDTVVPSVSIKTPEINIRVPEVRVEVPKIDVRVPVVGWTGNYNCGSVNWSGSAIITVVGDNYYTLDNGRSVYFANCSSRRYCFNGRVFKVKERVNYECYDDGKTIWAKRFDCAH